MGTVRQIDSHVPGHHIPGEAGTIKSATRCSPPAITDAARGERITDHGLLATLGGGKLVRFYFPFIPSGRSSIVARLLPISERRSGASGRPVFGVTGGQRIRRPRRATHPRTSA